jgi:hypothetical protein
MFQYKTMNQKLSEKNQLLEFPYIYFHLYSPYEKVHLCFYLVL